MSTPAVPHAYIHLAIKSHMHQPHTGLRICNATLGANSICPRSCVTPPVSNDTRYTLRLILAHPPRPSPPSTESSHPSSDSLRAWQSVLTCFTGAATCGSYLRATQAHARYRKVKYIEMFRPSFRSSVLVIYHALAQAPMRYHTAQPHSAMQERAREGKAKGAAATALACGAVAAGGSDHDRLRALRALAGLWLTHRGADLEAALRGWTLVLTTVDVRTLSTPLIDATLHHLAQHLAVRPPPASRVRSAPPPAGPHPSHRWLHAFIDSVLVCPVSIQFAPTYLRLSGSHI